MADTWPATGLTEYRDIGARAAAVFDTAARLPGQVFAAPPGEVLFCEFDAVLTEEFWPALRDMARWHGDDRVDLLVLEQDGGLPGCGRYPAVSLPVGACAEDYWAAIGFDPADGDALGSIAISADVVAVTGPSGRWGCWGERDPEVAVFRGFPSPAVRDAWRAEHGPFLEVSGALASYLPPTFGRSGVPQWYAAELTARYGR
ncbi:hypothetical protein [Kitasatospora arboriphila]|uniref:Uncharacterized protein n=1 Tax=Kitasatospora arboriphila TaxID=258052 RepID=A0ABN1U4D7_9ACTN